MSYHEAVLLEESVDGLNIKPDGVYVDVTFGGGGHSKEILKRLGSKGRLIAFDQDPEASINALVDERFTLVNQNFSRLIDQVHLQGHQKLNGLLADLGVSSHQFDSGERGFSFRYDAVLDMRMDQTATLHARTVVNEYDSSDLKNILKKYGELNNAQRIANAIIRSRPIETSYQLVNALKYMAPPNRHQKFFAQVFQALRIEVNDEMEVLKKLLMGAKEMLDEGGRLVVISYHSLEDRLVKNFMRTGNFEGEPIKDFYGNLMRPFVPVNNKPYEPPTEEVEKNKRSRSAKLRIAVRQKDE